MQTLGTTNLINYVQITQKPTFSVGLFDLEMMSDFNDQITSLEHNVEKTSTKLIVLTTRETMKQKIVAFFIPFRGTMLTPQFTSPKV